MRTKNHIKMANFIVAIIRIENPVTTDEFSTIVEELKKINGVEFTINVDIKK